MKLGSLFDGSGTCPLAATMVGIEPVWASEIEPYPIKVTTAHFPHMKHLGDVTKISGSEIEPVDIITFGSPCQNLSMAGNRKGLSGEKSGLFYEGIRIIHEMREATNGRYPRFAVWENVFGAFSSNKGADFQAVLQAFCDEACIGVDVPRPEKWRYAGCIMADGFSLAWRTMDAQYWGVPQRRRRVFLTVDFRDGGGAPEILFKRPGVSGNFKSCGASWEGPARNSAHSAGAAGGDVACVLESSAEHASMTDGSISPTIIARAGTGGNQLPLICYGITANSSNSMKSDNPHSGVYEANSSRTLDANGGNPVCAQGGMMILDEGGQILLENHPHDSRLKISEDGIVQTLSSQMGTGGNNTPMIMQGFGDYKPGGWPVR